MKSFYRALPLFLVFFLPTSVSAKLDQETPVQLDDIRTELEQTENRPWRKPNYSKQEGKLGYSKEAFAVPPGLEKHVGFWIDIYSKYTLMQGVVHDSEHVDIVHEVLDFSEVGENERERKKLVESAKERAQTRLKFLHGVTDPSQLKGADKITWEAYQHVDEPDRFLKAAESSRMRFQLGQKDRFRLAVYYSGRYIEEFEKTFDRMNIPRELVRLVFVESSFNVFAQSKVGASGLWQIMPRTGRQYMRAPYGVDYRNYPPKATVTAAKVLQLSYRTLESWPLATTGYNHGPSGVRRLTEKYKTRSIVELIQNVQSSRTFGFASRNFFASFLAALEVEKNADKYFPGITWSPLLKDSIVVLPKALFYRDLLPFFKADADQARLFNPHLQLIVRKNRATIPGGVPVHVPKNQLVAFQEYLKKARPALAIAQKQKVNKTGKVHKVRQGENLKSIAKKYQTTAQTLQKLNGLKQPNLIVIGQELILPD